MALYGLVFALAGGSSAYALPTGGQVSAGSATIAGGPGALTVNQSSQNAAINWQSFSIGQGEAVTFAQPNSQSVALNRVVGADPSNILGNLSANGKVFLVNPNGILFGPSAQVNVAGLVASTLDITDADFMAGRYSFSGTSGSAVLNQGSINADGGYVALLGASVNNQGAISARLGTVALAGGSAVTLDIAGDGLLSVAVDQGAVNAVVQNGGLIRADGGQVLLTTQAAGLLLKTVVNNTGVIEAQSVDEHGGAISLSADMQSGVVNLGGTLDVSGPGAGQTGGAVTATGYNVGLFGGRIIASGDAGGGTVLIGGDLHGANPAIQNASATYMSSDSTITADAITTGNGGQVVLWSNNSTRAYGSITARGGALGGDGGLIETSGHWLDVTGINVNASAPNGVNGSWLLDPADVTIGTGTTGGTFLAGVFSPNSGVNSATVDASQIQSTLNGSTNVTITTTNNGVNGSGLGDITVASALTWTTGQTLTLNAAHDVIVNPSAAITASTQNSKIVLTAGTDVLVNAALTASAQGSQILLTAGNNVTATAAITASYAGAIINMGAGNNVSVVAVTADGVGTSVNLHANKDVIINDALSAAGGNVILRADDDGTGPGVLGGTVRFAGPGKVVASATTTIRFNPDGYANTATEIANYVAKVTGALDAEAWVFALGVNRPYNGLLTDTLQFKNPTPADNPNVGNNVTLSGGTATFVNKDVGTLKTVNFSGYTLSGPDAARFALYSAPGVTPGIGATTANITPIPLTVTANNHAPKTYGSTVSFAGTEYTSLGLVNSETIGGVTLTSAGAPALAPVGTYAITPSNAASNGAFAPSNYTITYVDGALTVNPAPLTVTANDHVPKTYGDTVSFAGTEYTSLGLLNGETIGSVTLTSAGAPASATVGTYAITPSNATGGSFAPSNYTIAYVNGALSVVPIVTPPVVTPPVVIPPTGTSPTGTSPGETSPGETSPGETPVELTAAVVTWPVVTTIDMVTRSVVGPAGSTLAVLGGGVRMPPQLVETQPVPPSEAPPVQAVPQPAPPAPNVTPVPPPSKVEAPPVRPRKQDRY